MKKKLSLLKKVKTFFAQTYVLGMTLFLALILIGFPAMLVIQSFVKIEKNETAEKWPTTQGEILESRLQGRKSSKRSSATRYIAKVRYKYRWEGRSYEGREVSSGDLLLSKSYAGELLEDELSVGKIVTVYVNPEDPSDSLLMVKNRLLSRQAIWNLLGGCCFLSLVGLAIYLTIRGRFAA